MKVLLSAVTLLSVLCTPLLADETADRAELFAALKASDGPAEARGITEQIWQSWIIAPQPSAQRLLDEAMRRRARADLSTSETLLDALIIGWPGFAEGWNQRATVRYLRGNHDASLADIEEVLAREPRHFGALAGRAFIMMARGEGAEARKALEAAVKIHPWLRERDLIDQLPAE